MNYQCCKDFTQFENYCHNNFTNKYLSANNVIGQFEKLMKVIGQGLCKELKILKSKNLMTVMINEFKGTSS